MLCILGFDFHSYFCLFCRCVRAEPEAVFAALLVPALRSTFDAAAAEEPNVTFSGALLWDNAEPAADLADLLAFGLRNTLDAAVAARFPVTSLFCAMILSLRRSTDSVSNIDGRRTLEKYQCQSH